MPSGIIADAKRGLVIWLAVLVVVWIFGNFVCGPDGWGARLFGG